MDRRLWPSNGRAAHVSLRGQTEAETFTEGQPRQIATPTAPLIDSPGGGQLRELLFGEPFRVIDPGDTHAFGIREIDGYCGYIAQRMLAAPTTPTHRVAVRQSYMKHVPDLKQPSEIQPLHFGARLTVTGQQGGWARITVAGADRYLPQQHIRPIDTLERNPVAVARMFLGAPYLWGGNSTAGIDCSGLIQAAMLACGIPCQGDSDLQSVSLGQPVPDGDPDRPGDIYFWKGHVGLVGDPDTLIHANAHHMSVVEEPLATARARIEALTPVIARRRLP